MNLAGELVLSRNQLLQALAGMDRGNLESVSIRLSQVTSNIQEAIMQTRLQVVETIFNKFPRVVRDLSDTLGKQCELTVEGEDVELDKSIIEAIGDPLTHLIRNAVDHGVETAETRLKAGKPAMGRISLKAFHQAGKVHIAVSDDGAGIDAAKLKAKAVSRGVITAEQARKMGERESLRLIFRPGFSMAEKVTNVSGRGVGMDVVRTNIEHLGGTVDVETNWEPVPPSTSAFPDPGDHSFVDRAVPGATLCHSSGEYQRVGSDQGQRGGGQNRKLERRRGVSAAGGYLPLIRLSAVLGLDSQATLPPPPPSTPGNVNIIVVDTGHLRYGLSVDSLHDSEEIVVKPLGQHLKGCPFSRGRPSWATARWPDSGYRGYRHSFRPDGLRRRGRKEQTPAARGTRLETQAPVLVHQCARRTVWHPDGTCRPAGTGAQRPDPGRGRARGAPVSRQVVAAADPGTPCQGGQPA